MAEDLIEKLYALTREGSQDYDTGFDEAIELAVSLVREHQDEPGRLTNGGREVDNRLLDPDMPAQEMRLHMGELTAQEVRTARAAIRWANFYAGALPAPAPEHAKPDRHVPRARMTAEAWGAAPVDHSAGEQTAAVAAPINHQPVASSAHPDAFEAACMACDRGPEVGDSVAQFLRPIIEAYESAREREATQPDDALSPEGRTAYHVGYQHGQTDAGEEKEAQADAPRPEERLVVDSELEDGLVSEVNTIIRSYLLGGCGIDPSLLPEGGDATCAYRVLRYVMRHLRPSVREAGDLSEGDRQEAIDAIGETLYELGVFDGLVKRQAVEFLNLALDALLKDFHIRRRGPVHKGDE